MLIGAALLGISGADMDLALETNDIAGYLAAVEENRALLVTNLTLWIFDYSRGYGMDDCGFGRII